MGISQLSELEMLDTLWLFNIAMEIEVCSWENHL